MAGSRRAADLLDGHLLARRLKLLAFARLEERHVADLGLDQVVHEDHLQGLLDVDGLFEMAVHQQRHERHLPTMFGNALLPAARQPAVPQLKLEALGEGEEIEDAFDLIHHGPSAIAAAAGSGDDNGGSIWRHKY